MRERLLLWLARAGAALCGRPMRAEDVAEWQRARTEARARAAAAAREEAAWARAMREIRNLRRRSSS